MWANWVNLVLGVWLIISPFTVGGLADAKTHQIVVGVIIAVLAYLANTQKAKA